MSKTKHKKSIFRWIKTSIKCPNCSSSLFYGGQKGNRHFYCPKCGHRGT
jgi:DNA-directed RNA polymerase subunit RPC12/RpoP